MIMMMMMMMTVVSASYPFLLEYLTLHLILSCLDSLKINNII